MKSLSDCEGECRNHTECFGFAFDNNSGSCNIISDFQAATRVEGVTSGHADCSKCLLTSHKTKIIQLNQIVSEELTKFGI